MHEDVFRADDGYGSATQAPLPLPLDFEAHYGGAPPEIWSASRMGTA
ncbi:hypothetical protein AB0D62_36070 [Streptomyces massasporeus]